MSTKQARIYLDHNATTPLEPAALDAIVTAASMWGNPSSLHTEGRAARAMIEKARSAIAASLGIDRYGVNFTSGGTEAVSLGILGLARSAEKNGKRRIVCTTPIEHPSVHGAVDVLQREGWEVRYLPVARSGLVSVDESALHQASVVAIAWVNHELGTIAPLAAIAAAAKSSEAALFVDAVQAFGKIDTSLLVRSAQAFSISAHKIGGPKGIGALCIPGVDTLTALPLVAGGQQERGRRPGTENTLAIGGFGAAASELAARDWTEAKRAAVVFETAVAAFDGATVNGASCERTGLTVNVSFAGVIAQSIVIALDLHGISVSAGAACSSGSSKPSPVLLALAQTEAEAQSAVRFSFGRGNTVDEVERVLAVLPSVIAAARR